MRSLLRRVLHALRRARFEADLAEELEFHRAMKQRELEDAGLDAGDASLATRRALGDVELAREQARDVWIAPWARGAWQDLRFAARSLAEHRSFTTAAVLTLALGIGATTAVFSMAYAVLLQPLPYREPERLVQILKRNPTRGWVGNPVSAAELLAWRGQAQAFDDVASFKGASCVVTGGSGAEELPCELVGSNLFSLLGVAPLVGRGFTAEEDHAIGGRAAILSYGLWQRRFGAERAVIGHAIAINGALHVIVGVMPSDFAHLYASPDAPIPELWTSGIEVRSSDLWNDTVGVGRLRAGVSLEAAQTQLDAASGRVERAHPELTGWLAQITRLRDVNAAGADQVLFVLGAAVGFVLLIACANVASLLLARGAARASEMAVREALGAGRWRVFRQLLTESGLLALSGGALGVLIASWSIGALMKLAPTHIENSARGLSGAVDVRILLVAIGVSIVTTMLFGLAPAWLNARRDVASTLKQTSRGALHPSSHRLRSALLVTQVALAMVLLVGTGLMIRTLAALSSVDLGFSASGLLTLRVPLDGGRYSDPSQAAAFWRALEQAVEALPGVSVASASRGLPIADWAGQYFVIADRPSPPAGQVPDANYVVVGPRYFEVMRIPLRAGRRFDERDDASAPPVVIVSEGLARRQWPGESPIGKRLHMGGPSAAFPWLTVVGVAGNVMSWGRWPAGEARAELYVPCQQFPWLLKPQHLVVRADPGVAPASLARAVVAEIHALDPDLPASDIQTMEQVAALPMGQQRMVLALLGGFAAVAFGLATLGIYSVLSYSVGQRRREFGVRVALGARQRDVVRLVVGGGARLAVLGIGFGVVAALVLTRLMVQLLFGVRPADPVTYLAVAALLAAASLGAAYVPARRAGRDNPADVLRSE